MRTTYWLAVASVLAVLAIDPATASSQSIGALRKKAEDAKKALESRKAADDSAKATDFGIDGARIATKGLGDTKPSVPNATPEGRAQNRRVEVVKK